MNKRLKKKQHRLVSKWLADHPEYRPTIPLPLPIQAITYQPKEFKYRHYEHVATVEAMGADYKEIVKRHLCHYIADDVLEDYVTLEETTTREDLEKSHKRVFEASVTFVETNKDFIDN